MKRILFVPVIAALIFAGCEKRQSAAGPVVLEFYSWTDEEPYMTKLINQWNAANPDIQVKGTFTSIDDYLQKLTVSLSGGATVDIICQSNPAPMAEFIALGQILEMSDLMKKHSFDGSGVSGFLDSFRAELGGIYGLPYRKSVWVLFYNKRIFDAAGIPYPKNYTWEQYTDTARRLTSGSGENKIYGILNFQPTSGWWRIAANVTGANNPIIPEHLVEFKKAARLTWDWSYTDKVQPPYSERTGTAGGDYWGAFLQGKYGMVITGDWLVNMLNNGIAQGADLQYDIAEVPYWAGQEPYSAGVPTLAGITKSSKHPDEAFKFISFLAGNEGARFFAGEGMIPARGSQEIIDIFKRDLPSPKNTDVFFTQKVYNQAPFDANYNKAMVIVNQEMSLYFLNEQDLDTTYDTIARRIKDEI
jgi:multiple sugar transport system substrate-binding protein